MLHITLSILKSLMWAFYLLGRKFIGFEQEEQFVELSRLRRNALQDPEVFSDMLYRMMQPDPPSFPPRPQTAP